MSDTRDPEQLRAEAAQMRQQARELEIRADLRDAEAAAIERLRAKVQTGNLQRVETATERKPVRVSLRAIAEAVGVSHVLLSKARRGEKRIRKTLAEAIASIAPQLPATRKTWPKGWVDED